MFFCTACFSLLLEHDNTAVLMILHGASILPAKKVCDAARTRAPFIHVWSDCTFPRHPLLPRALRLRFSHLPKPTDLEVIADHRRGVLDNLEAAVAVDRRPASKMDRTPFELKGGVHGCTVDGTIEVERAAGAIVVHVMNHDPSRVIFSGGRLVSTRGETRHGPKGVAGPNVTHKIHDFGFGPSVKGPVGEGRNSLAGSTFVAEHGSGYVKYSLKVVPISYKRIHGTEIKTHTYSANVGFRNEDDSLKSMSSSGLVIGVEFSYDFTPVMVRYTDTRKSMFEFITSVCAIVGGIYTVSGLVVRGLRGVSRKKHD